MRTKTNFLRIVLAIHICMVCTSSNAQKAELEVESFKQGYFLFEIEPDGKSVSIEWNRESEISGHIDIPSKVTNRSKEYVVRSIEDSAFSDCYDITSLSIPVTIEEIGWDAFAGCTNLSNIVISCKTPLSFLSIFQETAWYDNLPDGPVYIGTMLAGIKGEIPELLNVKDGTTAICKHALAGQFDLTKIFLPNSVTFIGEGAFDSCIGLTSIIIPNSVTTIESFAFYDCAALKSITLSQSLKRIEPSTFGRCSNLISAVIPHSVISIGDDAFSGCSSLSSVSIPNTVESIGGGAFSGTKIKKISIPNSVKKLCSYTFENCDSLSEVHLSDSLTIIGPHAFAGCKQIKSISIPKSVVYIGDDTFSGCESLTSINCVKDNKQIDTLQIHSYYKTIDLSVYVNDAKMLYHKVNDNSDVQLCGFENDVVECYIPSKIMEYDDSPIYSIISIAPKAFANFKNVRAIYIPASVKEIAYDAFSGCDDLEYLYIPLGSMEQFHKTIPSELCSKLREIDFSKVEKYRDIVSTKFTAPEILRDYGDDNYGDDYGEMEDGIEPVYSKSEPVVYNVKGNDEDDFAEETPIEPKASNNEVYVVVEEMPHFPDGTEALLDYIYRNIKYPADAKKAGIQGRVICNFVVERDGSITDIKVERSINPSLDKEAVRVIGSMPQWNPGKQDGVPVRVKYSLPVTFKL